MKRIPFLALALIALLAYSLSAQEKRRILLEQFSSEACTNCVPANVLVNSLITSMTDELSISWVIHHAGFYPDFLSVPESVELEHLMSVHVEPEGKSGRAVPRVMFNRELLFSDTESYGLIAFSLNGLENLQALARMAAAKAETVELPIEDVQLSYEPETRLFRVKVRAKTLDNYQGADNFYLNVALTEDHIKAEAQVGVPDGVEYYHRHALRKFLAGSKGLKVDPAHAEGEWELTIPAEWKVEDMRVIAFAHRDIGSEENLPTDASIYASREFVFPATGTAISTFADKQMKVFARNGYLQIEGDYLGYKIYDMQGRMHHNGHLIPGLYLVIIETQTGQYQHKVWVD